LQPHGERLEALNELRDHDRRAVHREPLDDPHLVHRPQSVEQREQALRFGRVSREVVHHDNVTASVERVIRTHTLLRD